MEAAELGKQSWQKGEKILQGRWGDARIADKKQRLILGRKFF